jgi:hypothetical protein
VTPLQSPGRRDGRAIAVYTAARVGLFWLCAVLGWLAGLSGPVLLIVALLVSGVLSWFLLRRQRIAMGGVVERRVTGVRDRLDARAAAEDAYVDAIQGMPSKDRTG